MFSLLVSALVLERAGTDAIDAFKSMWQYTDSTDSVVSTIITARSPYYVSALAVAIGFKMNLFNIGVDGQYRMAAVLAAAAGAAVNFTRGHPGVLHHPRGRGGRSRVGRDRRDPQGVAGRQRGALDAHAQLIATGVPLRTCSPITLRAKNETGDLVTKTKLLPPSSFIPPLNRFLELFGFHLPSNTQLNGFVVGAVLLGVGFYVLVWRTRFGFDLRATGANPAAARACRHQPQDDDPEDDADQWRARRPRRHRPAPR